MGERGMKEAWVTLATNDSYALGCLVLGNSLRRVQTTRQLVLMYTEGVSESIKAQLRTVFDSLVEVSMLDSEDARNLSLLGRPDLNVTYTKIHCWELTQYEKGVFLDADTFVLQNCDELFDREELSASPDAGWPDCFNSGVFVFRPSLETYRQLCDFACSTGSFDGGDQGLLNSFFNTWATDDIQKHLPFIYNVVSQAFYSYLPAFTQFRENIKIVHFIGPIKPWHHPFNTATKTVTTFPETGHCQEFLQYWWDLFMELVQPRLDPTLTPFIRYEYILPSSHPPPPPPSPHGMETSYDQDDQPSSYQVLYPYVPPALDQEFYTPPESQSFSEPSHPPEQFSPPCLSQPAVCHHEEPEPSHDSPVEQSWEEDHHNDQHGDSQQENPEVPHVVDMPIVTRSFHPYETHYAEEPLLLIDPDFPPPVMYESKQFEQILVEEADKVLPKQENGQLVISVVDDTVTDFQGDLENQINVVNGTCETHEVKDPQAASADVGGDSNLDGVMTGAKQDLNSNYEKEEWQVGGLVGELAQIKVGGGGESADHMILDDRERRLAWERGHADYLGADSFANIMKKLDEKMAPLPSAKESVKKGSQSEASLTKPQEPRKKKRPVTRKASEVDSKPGSRKTGRQRSQSVGSKSSKDTKEDSLGSISIKDQSKEEKFASALGEKLQEVKQ